MILILSRMYYFALLLFLLETTTTVIYTLSLHDALPISDGAERGTAVGDEIVHEADEAHDLRVRRDHLGRCRRGRSGIGGDAALDRKSTRLNSSHGYISYAVFCLKKKII